MAYSEVAELIRSVRPEDREAIVQLVDVLQRQLTIARAILDAMDGQTVTCQFTCSTISDPQVKVRESEAAVTTDSVADSVTCAKPPGKKRGGPRKADAAESTPPHTGHALELTDKAITVGRLLLKHGPLTKGQVAERLGWKYQQAAMVIGRGKQHFRHVKDGEFTVSDKVASFLGGGC